MDIIRETPLKNTASRTFRDLHRAFLQDADAPQVQTLAANLAARIAAEPHPICLGIFAKGEVRKLYGLTHLLSQYGVTLRSKRRQIDEAVFVYGEIELPVETQFVGAFVQAKFMAAQGVAA